MSALGLAELFFAAIFFAAIYGEIGSPLGVRGCTAKRCLFFLHRWSLLITLTLFSISVPIFHGSSAFAESSLGSVSSAELEDKIESDAVAETVSLSYVTPTPQNGIGEGVRKPTTLSYLLERLKTTVVSHLQVATVSVTGTYYVTQQRLLSQLELEKPSWVWDLYRRDLVAELGKDPWIEKASTSIALNPPTLTLNVKEAEPWLVVEYLGHSWLVSRSGRLIQPLNTISDTKLVMDCSELPRVDGIDSNSETDPNKQSELTTNRVNYAVRLLRLIELAGGLPLSIERFTLLPEGGLAAVPLFPSEPEILLDVQSYSEAVDKLRSLGSVLLDLKRRGESARRIDLRFKNRAILS